MPTSTPRRIVVAVSGASGAVYGLRVLQTLLATPGLEIHFTLSKSACKVLHVEHDITVDLEHFDPKALKIPNAQNLHFHHPENVAAPMASGSFRAESMVIVPCSMGCIGRIAHGVSDGLIERAADVMLKEHRRLVVVPRETPYSAIQLENMLTLAKLGVSVLPASPGFYGRPQSIDELIDFVAARVLDHLNVEHALGTRWGEKNQE